MSDVRFKIPSFISLSLLPAFIIAILTASSACRYFHRYTPLSMELAISRAEVYESPDDRALVVTYQINLQNIFHNVRARYNPRKLEFSMISGICFRKVSTKRTFDTYLSMNTKVSKQFSDDKTAFDQRASAVFEDFTKPLLFIAARERIIFENSSVVGILITTQWQAKRTVAGIPVTLVEQLSLAVRNAQIESYLNNQITDQELLDQSTVIAFNEETADHKASLRVIPLGLHHLNGSHRLLSLTP